MAAVGRDERIFFCDGVLNAHSNCFLADGEMAETADFLLFV